MGCCPSKQNRVNVKCIEKHIMISYSWKYKSNIVLGVYEELKSAGFNVWIDRKEGINSNMNLDMANAVENAYVITKGYNYSDFGYPSLREIFRWKQKKIRKVSNFGSIMIG